VKYLDGSVSDYSEVSEITASYSQNSLPGGLLLLVLLRTVLIHKQIG